MPRSVARVAISFVLVSAFVAAGASGASYSGSITNADPFHANYANQNMTASSCAAPKSYPGTFTNGFDYHYDTYSEPAGGAGTACMTIQVSVPAGVTGAGATAFAYLGSFNPADLSQNYLGDVGGEILPGQSKSFSVNVPSGQTLVAEVEEWGEGTGVSSYDLTISGGPTAVRLLGASAARSRRGVVVRWGTANELGVLGFDVYRLVKGGAVRINPRLIAASAGLTRPRPSRYSVLDPRPSGANVLAYRIDAVDLHGGRSVLARVYARPR